MKRCLEGEKININYLYLYLFSLPTLTVDETYLTNLELKTDEEVIKKCVICMEKFEVKEILKTLPCCN